jgi:hypothetical protein
MHFVRQSFDDYNESCQMMDGHAAIHPHNLGFLMLRGISSLGPYAQAKQCAINAFDTNNFLSTDEVMATILHLAQNMEDVEQSTLMLQLLPSLHSWVLDAIPIEGVTMLVAVGVVVAPCRTNVAAAVD